VIAEAIERRIIDAGWPVGQVLGSEADFMAEFNVSRAVAREAVRVLEARQMIRPRRGHGGGVVVVEPDESAVIGAMTLCLIYDGTTPQELGELRYVLEMQALDDTIAHLDDESAERLRRQVEIESDLITADDCALNDNRSSYEFHLLLGELSNNRALLLFERALLGSIQRRLDYTRSSPELATVGGTHVHFAHRRITEAILQKDLDTARARMARHLVAINRWMVTHSSWEEDGN
jgi:DNA-binding FadR family transcriptional regulator